MDAYGQGNYPGGPAGGWHPGGPGSHGSGWLRRGPVFYSHPSQAAVLARSGGSPETLVQLYKCIPHAPEQHWRVSGGAIQEGFSTAEYGGPATLGWGPGTVVPGSTGCVADLPVLPPGKPPPVASPFCPKFHPIHMPPSYGGDQGPPASGGVYDPSGPLLDENGTW